MRMQRIQRTEYTRDGGKWNDVLEVPEMKWEKKTLFVKEENHLPTRKQKWVC